MGEGGAISFIDCHGSFDGLASGGANDSVFVSNDAPRKVTLVDSLFFETYLFPAFGSRFQERC